MKKLHLIITLIFWLSALSVHAQENASRQIFNQAESEFAIGRVEQAIQLLQDNLVGFDGLLKQSAYRLLALCYLSEDRTEEARYYAEQLIKLNNYYNSTDDPARFQELISQLKEGIATTITTASSQSESINEAPGPITIITSEMIEDLGNNKDLGQILAAYVPGIAKITHLNEGDNLSMHGAFSNTQELILVMENGHRLNTRYDNSSTTGYSISTEKIDHIEVLRGPASSLYGNVALSAVVNIITKSGRELDGVKVKYGYGSFNTHKADLTVGTQFLDADIFAWASIYSSDGQIRHLGDGEGYPLKSPGYTTYEEFNDFKYYYFGTDQIIVDGYKDKPSYDVGLTFRLKGFALSFSRKNTKKILPKTTYYGGYDYDKTYPLYGIKPGNATESTHADIGYTRQLGKFSLDASLYSDWYDCSYYNVILDSSLIISPQINQFDEIVMDTIYDIGRFSFSNNNEHTIGGYFRASSNYQHGIMKGSFLFGCQFEHFSLLSMNYLWGERYSDVINGNLNSKEINDAGNESIMSFFLQAKHYFQSRFILNAGFRYDLKYRQEEDVVKSFSPRLALLYIPHERFSLKLSYSEAFADLSFYNRFITKTDYTTLEPQHLSALQLTAMGTFPALHLTYEANLFYNKYNNLLNWLNRDDYSNKNTGQLTNIGFEGIANYAYKRFSANLSLYYCHDVDSRDYYYNNSKKMVCAVPHFTLNLHAASYLLQGNTHELKIYGQSSYTGKKLNYGMQENQDFFVDGKLLFDLGIKYSYKQNLKLSLDCENIFDTYHYICGPNYEYVPEFQKGRMLMASVSYRF